MYRHKSLLHSEIICNVCNYVAKNMWLIRSHIQSDHQSSNKDLQNLRNNPPTFIKNKKKAGELLSCADCNYISLRKEDLVKHINAVHLKLKKFQCSECQYKVYNKGDLKKHLLTHGIGGFKPHSCSICDYKCNQKTDLKNHMSIHNNEIGLECEKCSKKFSCKKYLRRHFKTSCSFTNGQKKVNENKLPKKCPYCNYKPKHRTSLRLHIESHLGPKTWAKKYQCTLCSYVTNRNDSLKKHLLTHTGEKPFKCTYCNFSCSTSSYFYRHNRNHLGVKPLKCDYCSKKFFVKDNLIKHIEKTHEKDVLSNMANVNDDDVCTSP